MSTNANADGYPTEETLEQIRQWPADQMPALFAFVREAWHWPDLATSGISPALREACLARDGDEFMRFATGGWSGNEDLIAALRENRGAMMCWRLSACGGLHIYRYE